MSVAGGMQLRHRIGRADEVVRSELNDAVLAHRPIIARSDLQDRRDNFRVPEDLDVARRLTEA